MLCEPILDATAVAPKAGGSLKESAHCSGFQLHLEIWGLHFPCLLGIFYLQLL